MIEAAVAPIRGQLESINQRVESVDHRADRAEQRADSLQAQLADAQASERHALELVKYVTAEAGEQRKRADNAATAERIARDEAAGLRAELDARREWGLRRRLRWALSRRRAW